MLEHPPEMIPRRQVTGERLLVYRLARAIALVPGARDRDGQHRYRPCHEGQAPTVPHRRQHERNGQGGSERFPHQEAVAVDGRAQRDAMRDPLAHDRWERRLHDRDAHAHREGRREQQACIGRGAAQRGADRGEHGSRENDTERAEPRDEERARHRREGEQQHGEARQRAHLRLREREAVVNHRHHRRHGEHRGAQAQPEEPQQYERFHGSAAR